MSGSQISDNTENEVSADLPLQHLPLDEWHRAKGARMVGFAGYEMPIQYEGIMAEHLWTRERAGLFDVSHMGQLMVRGDRAAEAIEALVPGDISALRPGRMRYSLLLADDGGILDDLMIAHRGDYYLLVVNGATKWDDIAYLRKKLPDDITLNHMDEHALLALQGPMAVTVLVRMSLAPAFSGGQPVEELTFMTAAPYYWGDVPLGISRSGYTGEDGFEISVRSEHVCLLADFLANQPEVKPIGLGARDSLRLEAGLPLYGHDLDRDTDPVSADLAFAISKRRRAEGGFAGSGHILAVLSSGPARKRIGLAVDGKLPVREGAPLFDGDTQVGTVTSGGFAPSLGTPIAMGYVVSTLCEPGTKLEAEVRGRRVSVTVAALPFVPHRYHRKPSIPKGAA